MARGAGFRRHSIVRTGYPCSEEALTVDSDHCTRISSPSVSGSNVATRIGSATTLSALILAIGFLPVQVFGEGTDLEAESSSLDAVSADGPSPATVWAGRSFADFATTTAPFVAERRDGAVIIAGDASSPDGEYAHGTRILALSSRGDLTWQEYVGGENGQKLVAVDAIGEADVLLIQREWLGNERLAAPLLTRIGQSGELVWERRLVSDALAWVNDGDVGPDGSVALSGGFTKFEGWVARLDATGHVAWSSRLTRSGQWVRPHHVAMLRDGGVAVGGQTDNDAWLARFDPAGSLRWSVTVGGDRGEYCDGVSEMDDGGLFMIVSTASSGSASDIWTGRFDPDGDLLWSVVLGGAGSEVATAVSPGPHGDVWISGNRTTHAENEDSMAEPLFQPWFAHVTSEGTIAAEFTTREPSQSPTPSEHLRATGVGAFADGGAALVTIQDPGPLNPTYRVIRVDRTGRVSRGFPWLVPLASPLRVARFAVRNMTVDIEPVKVEVVHVKSDRLGDVMDRRNRWDLDSPPTTPEPATPPPPRNRPVSSSDRLSELPEDHPYRMLEERRYDELETRIHELVEQAQSDLEAAWDVSEFYRQLMIDDRLADTGGMDSINRRFEEWKKRVPDSIAARVALARAWEHRAWEVRGSGFSNTVKGEAMTEFNTVLKHGWDELLPLIPAKPADPEFWATALRIAHAGPVSSTTVRQLFSSATGIAPDYVPLYQTEIWFRTPRWGGASNEPERFAAEHSDRRSATLGDELYARCAGSLTYQAGTDKVFSEFGFKWPRIRSGLRLMCQRYPSRGNTHVAAHLAYVADDRDEARKLFSSDLATYGDDVAGIWKSEARYLEARRWALQPPPPPWARSASSLWPPLVTLIEPGDDPWPDHDVRIGFVTDIDGIGAVLVTAASLSPGSTNDEFKVDESLQRTRLRDRMSAWTAAHPRSGSSPGSAIEFLGAGLWSGTGARSAGIVLVGTPVRPDVIASMTRVDAGSVGVDAESAWIVDCVPARSTCVQRVTPAQIPSSRYSSHRGEFDSFTCEVDAGLISDPAIGSLVLDSLGHALGVVTERNLYDDMSDPSGTLVLTCASLRAIEREIQPGGDLRRPLTRYLNNDLMQNAVTKLIVDRRWEDLVWLTESVKRVMSRTGEWLALGVLEGFSRRQFEVVRQSPRNRFDVVGERLLEWHRSAPDDPLAELASLAHIQLTYLDEPTDGIPWNYEDRQRAEAARCAQLEPWFESILQRRPDDPLVLALALKRASTCGTDADIEEALAAIARVDADNGAAFEMAIRIMRDRNRWNIADLTAAIDRLQVLGGKDLRDTLYARVLLRYLRNRNRAIDPEVDRARLADSAERLATKYPDNPSRNTTTAGVLCRLGYPQRAASWVEERRCSDIHFSGSLWDPDICYECFNGDVVPHPATTPTSETLDEGETPISSATQR
jgi:hypothetical protein